MATYERLKLYVSPTDSEHRGYYEAAKQGNLVVQRCTACKTLALSAKSNGMNCSRDKKKPDS